MIEYIKTRRKLTLANQAYQYQLQVFTLLAWRFFFLLGISQLLRHIRRPFTCTFFNTFMLCHPCDSSSSWSSHIHSFVSIVSWTESNADKLFRKGWQTSTKCFLVYGRDPRPDICSIHRMGTLSVHTFYQRQRISQDCSLPASFGGAHLRLSKSVALHFIRKVSLSWPCLQLKLNHLVKWIRSTAKKS